MSLFSAVSAELGEAQCFSLFSEDAGVGGDGVIAYLI
jgi:hypothetical protein